MLYGGYRAIAVRGRIHREIQVSGNAIQRFKDGGLIKEGVQRLVDLKVCIHKAEEVRISGRLCIVLKVRRPADVTCVAVLICEGCWEPLGGGNGSED